ncbi:MAG: hypothetical protein ABH878_02750 [bacterium]
MTIKGIIWLNEIIEKLLIKHNVQVTEVLVNRPKFRFVEKGHRKGESLYAAQGKTNSGRYLIVFFILIEREYSSNCICA